MRYFVSFFISLLSFAVSAQTGGAYVHFIHAKTGNGIEAIAVCFEKDSSYYGESVSDENGKLIHRNLPAGRIKCTAVFNGKTILETTIFIQQNQLLYEAFMVDSVAIDIDSHSGAYDPVFGLQETAAGGTLTQEDIARSPARMQIDGNYVQVLELQMVSCRVINYSNSFLSRDGGSSGATITRQDIGQLPLRTASGIASTVGGVNSNGDGTLHIRGARSDANTYYLDGMRVSASQLEHIPKSYLGDVNVITGGIPANYGDVTGGVISVTSRNIGLERAQAEIRRERNQRHPFILEEPILPEPTINVDHFLPIYENDFLSPLSQPNSTFGLDVDRASWTYVKERFKRNETIQRDAVKMEEIVNAFDYGVIPSIPEGELIGIQIERSKCAWNSEHELVAIHVRAADLPKMEKRKPYNFVLLVDVSGSMHSTNKLDLLVEGFKTFVSSLNNDDRIAIVTYAGGAGVVLEPTRCANKSDIIYALDQLTAGGSTNGMGGIVSAYELAQENYSPEFNNRIILATDGDFNVGISSTSELKNYIFQQRGKGIYLTALGVGMGNYKNSILETLADNGDGNHFYINDLAECKKVLIDEVGNLVNCARDVKLNIEFNPNLVSSYRLIGYENRLMPSRDFNDDTKDGGEMGFGHRVVAVYEIVPGRAEKEDNHFVKTTAKFRKSELLYAKLRYKPFEDSLSIERTYSVKEDQEHVSNPLLDLVIGFGLQLRDSYFKGDINVQKLKEMAQMCRANKDDETELLRMIETLKDAK